MTPFSMSRQLAELRHNTQRLEQRHRALLPSRWQPLPSPQPAPQQPEWLRRGKLARVLDHGAVGR